MTPWVLVTGDFVKTGGMDVANHALASWLARNGHEVHLVAHRVDEELLKLGNVTFHAARKPMNSYYLGRRYLDRLGRKVAAQVSGRGGRVLVNGGNCMWGDINWVHYVHSAYCPPMAGGLARRAIHGWKRRFFLAEERRALAMARHVITASGVTRNHLAEHLGISREKITAVYYGTDPAAVRPATGGERQATRGLLGWPADAVVALFVGALGDRRKGFDTVFEAWGQLAKLGGLDCRLAVIGRGAEAAAWEERARATGLSGRISFLGFRNDVPQITRAADLLVAPSRYEPYGLAVHEALCSGVAAITSACSGVSEKFPVELRDLLLEDENDAMELARKVMAWHDGRMRYRGLMLGVSQSLRSWTWDHMSAEIVAAVEREERPRTMKLSA